MTINDYKLQLNKLALANNPQIKQKKKREKIRAHISFPSFCANDHAYPLYDTYNTHLHCQYQNLHPFAI